MGDILRDFLLEKRSAILDKWLNYILGTYPEATARYFRSQKDRFLNPVTYEFRESIGGIYQSLIDDVDEEEELYTSLDRIIRVRAVQDFTPSQAVGFIFLLKQAIRNELGKELEKKGLEKELLILEEKIDKIALFAFDIYLRCREQLYEVRIKDIKNKIMGLLKATGLVHEITQEEMKFKGDKAFI